MIGKNKTVKKENRNDREKQNSKESPTLFRRQLYKS